MARRKRPHSQGLAVSNRQRNAPPHTRPPSSTLNRGGHRPATSSPTSAPQRPHTGRSPPHGPPRPRAATITPARPMHCHGPIARHQAAPHHPATPDITTEHTPNTRSQTRPAPQFPGVRMGNATHDEETPDSYLRHWSGPGPASCARAAARGARRGRGRRRSGSAPRTSGRPLRCSTPGQRPHPGLRSAPPRRRSSPSPSHRRRSRRLYSFLKAPG